MGDGWISDLHDAHGQGGPAFRIARLLEQPLVGDHVVRPLRVHIQRVPAQAIEHMRIRPSADRNNATQRAFQITGNLDRSPKRCEASGSPGGEAVEVGPKRILEGRGDRGGGGGAQAGEHLVVHLEAAAVLVRPASPRAGLGLPPWLHRRRGTIHGHGSTEERLAAGARRVDRKATRRARRRTRDDRAAPTALAWEVVART